jgi:hypothetical protein
MVKITVEELNEAYNDIHELDKRGEIDRTFIVEHWKSGLWFEFRKNLGPNGSWVCVSTDLDVVDIDE